jgi:hypothetical protein
MLKGTKVFLKLLIVYLLGKYPAICIELDEAFAENLS